MSISQNYDGNLEDDYFDNMEYILEINSNSDNDDNVYNQSNIAETSRDYKFDVMLSEMENCIQDTVDVRNMVQNISTDRSDNFPSHVTTDMKNRVTFSHQIDLMDEISRQKLKIECLCRDKQVLMNKISDLNSQLSILQENNLNLVEKLNMMKINNNDRPISCNYMRLESALSSHKTDIQRPTLTASLLQNINLINTKNDSNCKSSSWSELRTNRVIQDESFPSMAPVYRRNNSENNDEQFSMSHRFPERNEQSFGNRTRKEQKFFNQSDFKMWSTNQFCLFLSQIGLGTYTDNCKRWLIDGRHLTECSKRDIEKELGITNKLHLKKLLIHIRRLTSTHVPAATYFCLARPDLIISSHFDIRLWLDDIGLLHYMSLFNANGLDGYMIDQISMADLQHLKITNELHCLSLKRGIQLLRRIDYDLSVFIRRPSGEMFSDTENEGKNDNLNQKCDIPIDEVCRWTQHQVMEWLRQIELPEFASNIRGSGIHGALLIFEDRFNSNCLASVLNIPRNRSLLRRHLQAKFHQLIGQSLVMQKRAATESPGFVALTATSKMKFHRKKSIFDGIKRKCQYEQLEELLLPYTTNVENLEIKSQRN